MIAINQETDFVVTPWLKDNNLKKLELGEVIVGNNVDAEVGRSWRVINEKDKF